MFDFTKEIGLDAKNYKIYRKWQAAFWAIAAILVFYLVYLIIFPTQYFFFSFPNPNSLQNTIISPRNLDGAFTDHGKIAADKKLLFDAALWGNYSKANISFTLDKESDPIETANIEARKSYQAFFYPEGDPMSFKDGTLLKDGGNYFIISQGKLRKFANSDVIDSLGYGKEAFIQVSESDLTYNEKAGDITDSLAYPDSSIFKINDAYYILENQKLRKFISSRAYLTQYIDSQAIVKSIDFLNKYPLDENLEGFADGTLISYGISAFIVSSGQILPINNTVTFTNMGYDWDDVIAASGDEVSLYQKDKLFTIDNAHPNGTVMVTDDNKWYMIKDGQKHLLPSQIIAQTWNKKNPIRVSRDSLELRENCELSKDTLSFRTYSCSIPLDKFIGLLGKDYEFKLETLDDVKLNSINVSFQKTASWTNLRSAVSGLIAKIKGNYAPIQ